MEILFILRIHFLVFYLFFSYPPASEGSITVMIYLQYVIHKCAALSMLSHAASGV